MSRKGIVQVRDKVDRLNEQHGLNLKVLPPDGGPVKVTSLDVTTPEFVLSGTATEVWSQLDVLVNGVRVGRSHAFSEFRGKIDSDEVAGTLTDAEEIVGTLMEWCDENEVRDRG